MSDEPRPFLKNEKVYLPLAEGVMAPQGRVFADDGGEMVEVADMQAVPGVRVVTSFVALVPADRLRRCRRGRTLPAYTERPL